MNKEKISVIVPTYNVENEIEKCIRSICAQKYDNLEIIVIDDGSTDNSGKIADKLALEDSRVIVVHKENGGVGSARRVGLEIATGDLIGFVDADDYINCEMYDELYRNMIEHGADMSACFGKRVTDEAPEDYMRTDTSESKVSTRTNFEVFHGFYNQNHEDNVTNKYFNGDTLSLCNKLFRREIIKNITFPELFVGEDAFVYFDILKQIKKAVYVTKEYYYYYNRSTSLTKTKVYSEEKTEFILENRVKRSVRYRDILHESKYYDLEKQCVNIEIFNLVDNCGIFADTAKKRKIYKKHIKKLVRLTKDTKNALSFKEKIRLGFFIFSPMLYRKIIDLFY